MFRLFKALKVGVKSLALHPLRSLLTVLGIFIGVASVVWLLAIGEGISIKAREQIEGLGADNIIVRSLKPPPETTSGSSGPVPYGLTRDDYELLSDLPTVTRAIRIREIRRQFRYGREGKTHGKVDGRLVGCTPEYADVTQLHVDRGHFITQAEMLNEANVCVLAAGTAERLFRFEDPIGKSIHVDEDYYRVVGVMKKRTASAGIGGSLAAQDFDNDVYIPITTLWKRIGDTVVTRRAGSMEGEIVQLSQVTLRINNVENVLETAKAVENTLRLKHKDDDYAVVVPLELLEQAKTTRLMFIVFMGIIAAISLVVGGIGIMNIMLATVTERTREIGIRRALGAKRRDITRQFLVETVLLSIVGGLTGILGGFTCRPLVNWGRSLLESAFPQAMQNLPEVVRDVAPVVVPWSIPLAFGISMAVGVVFGLYPAMRAAAMDPIEALRHE
ncbi:MAG: ABC transporter permease [Pirellulales bacterium]|nr:ABC transporter permease [Pirellulales bacterium]